MMFKLSTAALLSMSLVASAATTTVIPVSFNQQKGQKQSADISKNAVMTRIRTSASAASMKSDAAKRMTTSSRPVVAIGQDGNGGGGVVKNGNYMTFYSAGLYVEPTQSASGPTQTPVPGLNEVISYISKLPYLSYKSKGPMLNALVPTDRRTYYVASPEALTSAVRARLLAEFQRVTGVDTANLKLFALTDTQTQTTFLLPEFFRLRLADQEAILFHEAYWIMHPDAQYNDVVKAEMAFEAALQSPNDLARVYDFASRVGSSDETYATKLQWAVSMDLNSGALNGLVQKDRNGYYIPLNAFLGQDFAACESAVLTPDISEFFFGLPVSSECMALYNLDANQLSAQYPKSVLLQNWRKSPQTRGNGGAVMTYKEDSYNYWRNLNDSAKCKVYLVDGENVICPTKLGNSALKFGWDNGDQ